MLAVVAISHLALMFPIVPGFAGFAVPANHFRRSLFLTLHLLLMLQKAVLTPPDHMPPLVNEQAEMKKSQVLFVPWDSPRRLESTDTVTIVPLREALVKETSE